MTTEEITQQVADMQARLDTCAKSGQAYRVKWSEVKSIITTIQTLQERLAQANDFNNDVVEREAAVCPEDVGFDEYIRALESRLADHQRIVKELEARVGDLENRSHQTVLFECGCMFRQDGLDAEPQLISHCVQPSLSDAIKEVEKARGEWAHLAEVAVDDVGETHWRAQVQAADKIFKRLKSLSTQEGD